MLYFDIYWLLEKTKAKKHHVLVEILLWPMIKHLISISLFNYDDPKKRSKNEKRRSAT